MRNPNLIGKLRAQVPAFASSVLDELISVAQGRNTPVYLVGGPLRDLLLNRPSLDIDIAVEGDAMALARELAERLSESSTKPRTARPEALVGRAAATTLEPRIITHPAFLTATIRVPGFHLDLITARSETYARPGALPTVQPATIHVDLLRRDFTINALALRLNGPEAGEVLDPSDGRADLEAHVIRVLHERSFQDDATRIVRSVRYATRFDFEMETQTLRWLRRDIEYLRKISPARIHSTLLRVLQEKDATVAARVLLQLDRLGALQIIHRDLRFSRTQAKAMHEVRRRYEYFSLAGWVLLTWPESSEVAGRLAWRLRLSALQREAVASVPRLLALQPALSRTDMRPSEVHQMLRAFGGPELWPFAAMVSGIVRERILNYLRTRSTRPELNGNDLINLGVPPSKRLGDILERLRRAKIDGDVRSREDEECFVQQLLRSEEVSTED